MKRLLSKPLIRLHLWRYNFTPNLIPTLTTIVLLIILFKLGFWQLHRAAYKRTLMSEFYSRRIAPPLTLVDLQQKKDVRYLLTDPVHKYIEEMHFYEH